MNATGTLNVFYGFFFSFEFWERLMHTWYFGSHWLAAGKQLATWQWMANQSAPLEGMHLILQLQNVIALDIYRSPTKSHAQPQSWEAFLSGFFLQFWGLVEQFAIWGVLPCHGGHSGSSHAKDGGPAPFSVGLIWGLGLHSHQREISHCPDPLLSQPCVCGSPCSA